MLKVLIILKHCQKSSILIFDKTGTITHGVFKVVGIHHSRLSDEKLLWYAAHAEAFSSHPISKSIREAYGKKPDMDRVTDVNEIGGNGVTAKVDGISVAVGNAKLMERIGVEHIDCHESGTIVHMAVDGEYQGHIVISDVIKPSSEKAVKALRKSGVKMIIMLTGDIKTAADKVAKKVGITEVYSDLLPADKVAKVEELLAAKTEKEKLAFVGDGINDAPVLSRADIGIAMGALGSDAAIEAATLFLWMMIRLK